MKKMKRLMGLFTAASMLLSSIPITYAADAVESAAANEVVYKLAEDENVIHSVTRQELETEHWDMEKLGDTPVEPYVEFPMSVESSYNNSAALTISLTYLKQVGPADSVNVTLTEYNTEVELASKDLNATDDTLYISDVPIGKTYSVVLDETLDGENKTYSGVITTQYMTNAFPPNITLNSVTDAEDVTLKVTEARTADNAGAELEDYIIPAAQLPELYAGLSSDKLYVIQMSAVSNDRYQINKAFFSTEASKRGLGIFIPRHTFYTEEGYLNHITQIQPMSDDDTDHIGEYYWTLDDLEDKATFYGWSQDVYLSFPSTDNLMYKVFKVNLQENADLTFRTYGNAEMGGAYWIYNPDTGSLDYNYIPPRTTNVNEGLGAMGGLTLYFLVYMYDNEGRSVFHLKYNNVTDDVTNSVYELAYPESGAPSYTAYNTELSRSINYGGDVDVFYINREQNYSPSNYSIRLKNQLNTNVYLYATLYADLNGNGDIFEYMDEPLRVAPWDDVLSADFSMPPLNGKFFVAVRASTNIHMGNYKLELLHPTFEDELEGTAGNDTMQTATVFDGSSGIYENTLTLHQGDVDYFKFTTGAGGADVDFCIYETWDGASTAKLYNLTMYEDSNGGTTYQAVDYPLGSTNPTNRRLQAADLKPNTDYYVKISSSGSKYSPGGYYDLQYDIENHAAATYSATLSGDVSINIQEDAALTTLDTVMNPILEKLTCKIGDTVVSDTEAQENIQLYYMNGTNKIELTPGIINGLAAGSYTVIAEYQNVAATGGTITLVITASTVSENVAEIPDVENEPVFVEEMDWLAAAKIVANVRLEREGYEANTTDIFDAAFELEWDDIGLRGDIAKTVEAAGYFYNDNQVSSTRYFVSTSVSASTAENTLFNSIDAGKAVIMQLTSTTDASDMSLARYLVLCGVNKDSHTFKVLDPITGGDATWVSQDILFNGGYGGDNTLKFTGRIIEGVSK